MSDADRDASPELDGMTLNERLATAGLISSWDKAIVSGNRAKVIAMLMKVRFTRAEAERWADDNMGLCLWQQMLPRQLDEYGITHEFEAAIRSLDADLVRQLLLRMGAPERVADQILPHLMCFYFFNYTELAFEEKEALSKRGLDWMKRQ